MSAEICEALLHLIRTPAARTETLTGYIPGPDFPTGGVLVEGRDAILEAYRTGRGSFRLRARWSAEDQGRGQYLIVVTEIPYGVQKGRLVERIADLLNAKRLPMLADVRDESAEDIRLVLEPRSRTVDPALLMEALFRHSDLEIRVPLNMNVLIDGRTPKVCGLAEGAARLSRPPPRRAAAPHRAPAGEDRPPAGGAGGVSHRLSQPRPRHRDHQGRGRAQARPDGRGTGLITGPKTGAGAAGARLTEVQAEAILNMRLRSLRRLEEMELRAERDRLTAEQAALGALLGDEDRQVGRASPTRCAISATGFGAPRALRGLCLAEAVDDAKARHSPYPAGARRTGLADPPQVAEMPAEATVEREPVTVVCSAAGLDQGAARPPAARRRAEIQGRRCAALCLSRRDHRPAARLCHQRTGLHAGAGPAAGAGAARASRCA